LLASAQRDVRLLSCLTSGTGLFVMCPHSEYLHADGLVYFINSPMLDIDATRISPRQISHEFLVRRRGLERIAAQNRQQVFHFCTQTCRSQIASVLLRLPRENYLPGRAIRNCFCGQVFAHQGSSEEHCSSGVCIPSRRDSRIPGIDSRYNVSSIERQSSSATRTTLAFAPLI